jgi:hypothetical protein
LGKSCSRQECYQVYYRPQPNLRQPMKLMRALRKNNRTGVGCSHSFALRSPLTAGAGADASELMVTLPVFSPSPKNITSTVKSSLPKISQSLLHIAHPYSWTHTCTVSSMDLATSTRHKPYPCPSPLARSSLNASRHSYPRR